jgi:hypothetical protein
MDSYRVFDRSGTGTVDENKFLDVLGSKYLKFYLKEIQIICSLK